MDGWNTDHPFPFGAWLGLFSGALYVSFGVGAVSKETKIKAHQKTGRKRIPALKMEPKN